MHPNQPETKQRTLHRSTMREVAPDFVAVWQKDTATWPDAIHETLEEWTRVERRLITSALGALDPLIAGSRSLQDAFEICIHHATEGRGYILWEPYTSTLIQDRARLHLIAGPSVRYGALVLLDDYLTSSALPYLGQQLADLCAICLALLEHRAFMHWQLAPVRRRRLHPDRPQSTPTTLTARERDTLVSLALGETEGACAERLGIEVTTVHTHRQRLFRRMDVHTAHEAVVLGSALRLIDWFCLSHLVTHAEQEDS